MSTVRKTTSIRRGDAARIEDPDRWYVGFTNHWNEMSSTTNVEAMTQGELLTLWRQIGVLFNLVGMRDGLTDEDVEKMGVFRK